MTSLIVVSNPKEWKFDIPGVEVIDARSYLTQTDWGQRRGLKVFNLCRSYRYQSTGYYVTLLATARGHRPVPGITTIQDMKSPSVVRFVSEDLEELIQKVLEPIHSPHFTLSIYFGRNMAKRYSRLSLELFNLFQTPLLRAEFHKNDKWHLRNISPITVGEVPETHREYLREAAQDYLTGRRLKTTKKASFKYDLAILLNEQEELAPSDPKAISHFVKAAESLGLRTSIVDKDDFARLAEFDALFIRETTQVNHHTYRFARRAAIEGLVVIDDPESILKCTNKVYLAELLAHNKIPAPTTRLLHKDNQTEVVAELGLPLVLKQPDSAFSQGVVRVDDEQQYRAQCANLLAKSDLIIAQKYIPTDFDWRIGVFDREPLYACKYHMAPKHWQIVRHEAGQDSSYGRYETIPVELAPRQVVRQAVKAANAIGDGLYGVDLKESGGHCYVIEVNDNPNIDAGVEDRIIKSSLYMRIMRGFLERIERRKAGLVR